MFIHIQQCIERKWGVRGIWILLHYHIYSYCAIAVHNNKCVHFSVSAVDGYRKASTVRCQKRSLPSSYLLSMLVRIRELLPKLASVSLSCGEEERGKKKREKVMLNLCYKNRIKMFINFSLSVATK